MIKHIVMFKLKEEADGKTAKENLEGALERLKNFQQEIPSLVHFEARTNAPEADKTNYELALVCDFNDIQGLNEYQVHPVHKNFGAYITPLRESRACIDYEY